MSQTYTDDLYSISMQAAATLQAMEDNFAALKSAFSGTSAPSNPIGGMPWLDTTNHLYKLRNEANSAWLSIWDMANNKPILSGAAITELPAAGNWKLFYSNGSKVITELALGASGTMLISGGVAAAPSFGGLPDASVTSSKLADAAVTGAKLLQATAAGTEIYLAKATTQRTTMSTSYVKIKETEALKRGGAVTVTFTASSDGNGNARLYKNGSAVGTERSLTTSEESFSENFTASVGDVFQVYAKSASSSYYVYSKNLYVTANDPYIARDASGY